MKIRMVDVACVLPVVAVCLFAPGCGHQPAEPEVLDAKPEARGARPEAAEADLDEGEDPVYALMQLVESKIHAGETEGALQKLDDALAQPALAVHRPRVFYMTLVTLLSLDAVAEAQSRMQRMLEVDFDLAQESIGVISEHLIAAGDGSEILVWTATLLRFDLPEPTRNAVLDWRLQGLYRAALDRLRAAHPEVDLQPARNVSRAGFADQLLRDLPEADRLETLRLARETLVGDRPAGNAWADLIATFDIRIALAQQSWQPALDAVGERLDQFSEGDLQRLLLNAIREMSEADALDWIDTYCEAFMQWGDSHPRIKQAAGYQWIRNAIRRETLLEVPARLDALLDRGADPAYLFGVFNRVFYETVPEMEAVNRMLPVADRLLPLLTDRRQRQSLRVLTLDGSFITQDYDRTIALLREGIPGRDPSWHELALSKVLAHQAIDNNAHEEAIKHLRAFMQAVMRSPEDATEDPATGIKHTRTMILGRNARRIGDLQMEAGNPGAARVDYATARVFYDQALRELDPDSPSAELARQERDDVPQH